MTKHYSDSRCSIYEECLREGLAITVKHYRRYQNYH